MTLYSALYGAANVFATYAWSMLPDSKARALEALIGDLGDKGASKVHWQKHMKAILWPQSVLQLAAIITAVASCICTVSTLLCFAVCIAGLLGLAACGVLAAAGVALLIFGVTTFIVSTLVATVTGSISLMAFTCTCFGIAAVGTVNRASSVLGGASSAASSPPSGGCQSTLPPSVAATADLDMRELPSQDTSKPPQDASLTPQLLFEMHGAPCAAAEAWPLSDPQRTKPGANPHAPQQPGTAMSPDFFSMHGTASAAASLASPTPLSQTASLGPSSYLTNVSPVSMQLGSESALGAESVQSRELPDDESAPRVLHALPVQAVSVPPVDGTAMARRRLKVKGKNQQSEGGGAPSVASERSVEELMDSAFMGGV